MLKFFPQKTPVPRPTPVVEPVVELEPVAHDYQSEPANAADHEPEHFEPEPVAAEVDPVVETPLPPPAPAPVAPPLSSFLKSRPAAFVSEKPKVTEKMPAIMPEHTPNKNVLSKDVEIKGNIKFTNELIIDGKIEGEISSDGVLTVGENADIRGEIKTKSVTVLGKVNGNIHRGRPLRTQGARSSGGRPEGRQAHH